MILYESLSQADRALTAAADMFAKADDTARSKRLTEMADEVAALCASFVEETGGEPVRPKSESKHGRRYNRSRE